MTVRVYVEGGGDTACLRRQCRKGFSTFFGKAGLKGRMPKIIAGGGRQKTFDDFRTACEGAGKEDFIVLLVDGEDPVKSGNGSWAHLENRDGWDKPGNVTDDNAHLMVQCMEAWFLADKDTLDEFFGDKFNLNALPAGPEVEDIAKADILNGLEKATRHCDRKGRYRKGRHSFEILARIDPARVTKASPHARSLIGILIANS